MPASNALIKDYGVCPTYRLKFPDSVINVVDNINRILFYFFTVCCFAVVFVVVVVVFRK